MLSWLIRRVLMLIPVFLAVSVVIFSILHFIPGDPIDNLLKVGSSPTARAEVGEPVSAIYKDLRVAARVNETGYGIAMRKGSDLKAPLDAYLAGLRDSGELEKILSRHGQGVSAKKP